MWSIKIEIHIPCKVLVKIALLSLMASKLYLWSFAILLVTSLIYMGLCTYWNSQANLHNCDQLCEKKLVQQQKVYQTIDGHFHSDVVESNEDLYECPPKCGLIVVQQMMFGSMLSVGWAIYAIHGLTIVQEWL